MLHNLDRQVIPFLVHITTTARPDFALTKLKSSLHSHFSRCFRSLRLKQKFKL